MPTESTTDSAMLREMLELCAESWLDSDPPINLDEQVSLRFGYDANLPRAPMKSQDKEEWVEWLAKVLSRFPLYIEDMERWGKRRTDPEIDSDLKKEIAQETIAGHLAPDPL